jgi:hypothetical protein
VPVRKPVPTMTLLSRPPPHFQSKSRVVNVARRKSRIKLKQPVMPPGANAPFNRPAPAAHASWLVDIEEPEIFRSRAAAAWSSEKMWGTFPTCLLFRPRSKRAPPFFRTLSRRRCTAAPAEPRFVPELESSKCTASFLPPSSWAETHPPASGVAPAAVRVIPPIRVATATRATTVPDATVRSTTARRFMHRAAPVTGPCVSVDHA